MNDLIFHISLFLFSAAIIVAVGCMHAEADDARALKLFPRRYLKFLAISAAVVVVMLVAEHTLASVS